MRERAARLTALPLWMSALLLLLTACATPVGGSVEECSADVETVGVAVPEAGVLEARRVSFDCYRVVRDTRLEVVFAMPPGPDCHGISIVEAVESGEAVAVELWIGRLADPFSGACPEEAQLWAVPVELNRSIGERAVLDASRPPD